MLKIKKDYKTRVAAVREYNKNGTLREVAGRYQIHLVTLARWVKRYRQGGVRNLRPQTYRKPWNRSPRELEDKVMKLKERRPGLTIRQARVILKQRGVLVSISGIHGIWKRYNLIRRPLEDPLSPFGPPTAELKKSLTEVRELLKGDQDHRAQKKAADILNRLPYYPKGSEAGFEKIPEKYLSARRRLDRLFPKFMKIPMPEFRDRMRRLKRTLEKGGCFYSSLIAGLNELNALQWMRTPREEIRLYRQLKRRKAGLRDPVLNFQLTLLPATAYVELGKMRESRELIRKSRRLLRLLPYASFYESYGDLMTFVGDYKTSLVYYNLALSKNPDRQSRVGLNKKIALSLVISGDYPEALRCITKLNIKPGSEYYEEYLSCRAFLCFGLGKFEQAAHLVRETLDRSEKQQFRNTIYSAVIVRSAIAQALGKTGEAQTTLRKYLKLMDKYQMVRESALLNFLLTGRLPHKTLRKLAIFQMIALIKKADLSRRIGDYRQAVQYARQKGLVGFLHRYLVFYPAIVLNLLKRGRKTYLPHTILRFPIFNAEVPSYELKFLGRAVVYRNQQYLKFRLRPKEEALLIHLALRMGEPGMAVPVAEIHRNFWPQSGDAASRLSHLLVELKQKLAIPAYLISFATYLGAKRLVNRGFYMTTDYQDFENNLIEAHALERAGEWPYARTKFIETFRLLRAAPFRRNYDNWSDEMRRRILDRIEQEAGQFLRSCWSRNNRQDARRVEVLLKKMRIPPPDGANTSLT
jgi:transposase/tetratricopeptide (TPR) repeat protein